MLMTVLTGTLLLIGFSGAAAAAPSSSTEATTTSPSLGDCVYANWYDGTNVAGAGLSSSGTAGVYVYVGTFGIEVVVDHSCIEN